MKSIWVIQKVKKGKEYADAATDRLWDCYVNELEKVSGLVAYSGLGGTWYLITNLSC